MKKVFYLFLICILCINLSFTGRRMMQVQAQSWISKLTTVISSLSSFISGPGESTDLLKTEERVGERDC